MISVVIPHYKGKEKLIENLSHNLPFLKGLDVIVVNDYPEIPLTEELNALFPTLRIIENSQNLGFAGAISKGIEAAKHAYVFLLNNDVLLHDNAFLNALTHFKKDKDLFAVSFCQTEKNGAQVGRNAIFWQKGFFQHRGFDSTKSGFTGWAEGGSMLVDKNKYFKIGGFDVGYSPFYWEDIDLSYRAWRSGYTVLFDAQIVVQHHHESTISTHFSSSRIRSISYRNQFLTIWKNITDTGMMWSHLFYTLRNLILYPLKGENEFVKGFWLAAQMAKEIMEKRSTQKKLWKRTDRDIFKLFNGKSQINYK